MGEGSAAGAQGVGQGVQSESSMHPLPGRAFVVPRLSEGEKGRLELQKGSGECNPAAPTPLEGRTPRGTRSPALVFGLLEPGV